jgi:hypothetical protein
MPKKCEICGSNPISKKYFNAKVCDEDDCRVKWSMKVVEKQKLSKVKKAKQDWNKEKSIIREGLMTLSEYEKEAKKVFQRFIRLRDSHLPCISCGNTKTNDWAGGHYFPAGIYSGFIFDERNCHKQCNTHCNKHLSGNLIEYRKGLIKRFDLAFVEQLESESNEKRNYKYSKNELIAKKLQYEIKIKELK